ncbi:MAG TPA: hypothetical protein VNF68_03390 [Candidatus Baltobacteraceae bacterium]|nr:hypothetical protein [Candidatus Baltobacteraceae bacterium]
MVASGGRGPHVVASQVNPSGYIDRCWSSRLDTMVTGYTCLYNSRMVIDACRPYKRIDSFPVVARSSPELAVAVRAL